MPQHVFRVEADCHAWRRRLALGACSTKPLVPYSADTPPLVLVPAAKAGVQDKRGALPRDLLRRAAGAASRDSRLPALRGSADPRRQRTRRHRQGRSISGPRKRRLVAAAVAGIGFECFEPWLAAARHRGAARAPIRIRLGSVRARRCAVELRKQCPADPRRDHGDAPANRARRAWYWSATPRARPTSWRRSSPIRKSAAAWRPWSAPPAPSAGSALANDAKQYEADLLRHFPGATCQSGDGGAVESLRPAMRRAWLAQNPLPRDVRYYSLVTFPQPERISSILEVELRQAGTDRPAQRQPDDLL